MSVEEVIQRHVRQIDLSPGIGEDKQRYGRALLQDVLDDLKAHTPTPPPNTVPVRIAVAVNAAGRWDAQGNSEGPDERMMDWANENVGYDGRITFITAHVPKPDQPAEVAGTVEWPHDHDHMEQQPHDAAGGRDE